MKCISIDLDGTLLDHDGFTVSDEDIQTIEQLKNKGYDVMINTGRSYKEIAMIPGLLELNIPLFCMNGTILYNQNHDKIFETNLNKSHYLSIMESFVKHKFHTITYTNKGFFVQNQNYEFPIEMVEPFIQKEYQLLSEEKDLVLYKIVATGPSNEELLSSIPKELKNQVSVTLSLDRWLEVNSLEATKGNALLTYQKIMNKKYEEIFAFGDGGNDFSQFLVATHSCAMGNAPDYVKEKADFITKKNSDSGFSYGIKNIFQLL